jgi:AAA domain
MSADLTEGATLVPLAEASTAPVRWLWSAWIPLGKLTVLDGDLGLGKSTLLLDLAARVSTGRAMPDGSAGISGDVCLLSAEDSLGDTIRPRLEAAGADLARIHALTAVWDDMEGNRPLLLPGDQPVLEGVLRRTHSRLLVLDPLRAHLAHPGREQALRRCLHGLADIAEQAGCAMVLLRHLGQVGSKAVPRGAGNLTVLAAARSGLLVARDPDSADRRVLACTKPSLSALPRSLCFRLAPGDHGACRVVWCGTSTWSADDLLRSDREREQQGALAEACQLLREVLKAGPHPARACRAEAEAAGVTATTLKRAKQRLGVRSVRVGFGTTGQWFWSLPEPTVSP